MFRETDYTGEADVDTEEGAEVEEVIVSVQQEILDTIDLTPANSNTLNEIFDKARQTYDKESKLWDQLFENLKNALVAASEDDDDDIATILDQYNRKAGALG
jgi:uncharacterized protein YegL